MLDRLIAAVSPDWALRRAQRRAALFEVQARYDAARRTRRTRGWRADATGPNAEAELAIAELRHKARDLVRNNAWISAGLDIVTAYTVGHGITPRSATGDTALDQRVNAAFAEWARGCDIGRRLDLYGLQELAVRGRAQDGEALALVLPLSPAEMRRQGVRVPLGVQVIEPDLLADSRVTTMQVPGRIEQGVELDDRGAPVAYHLLEQHPGERGGGLAGRSRRVPAENVAHLYRVRRAGQVRGVSDLAPFMLRARDLDELEEAALHQAKVQACLAAFVMSPAVGGRGPLESPPGTDGEPVRGFSPGMVERLLPGEDVKFAVPSGAGSFSELARHQLHAVASAWGITYDLLTGDLSQANYSSLRAGRLAFQRRLEQMQWLCVIPGFCEPIWKAWVAAAIRAGVLDNRPGGYPVAWCPPPFQMVDPLKDALALQLMRRLGLQSWSDQVAAQGSDPLRQAEELAEENALFDELGLILESDPRRTARSGAAQDAAQNAAIEIGATGAALPATDATRAAVERVQQILAARRLRIAA